MPKFDMESAFHSRVLFNPAYPFTACKLVKSRNERNGASQWPSSHINDAGIALCAVAGRDGRFGLWWSALFTLAKSRETPEPALKL